MARVSNKETRRVLDAVARTPGYRVEYRQARAVVYGPDGGPPVFIKIGSSGQHDAFTIGRLLRSVGWPPDSGRAQLPPPADTQLAVQVEVAAEELLASGADPIVPVEPPGVAAVEAVEPPEPEPEEVTAPPEPQEEPTMAHPQSGKPTASGQFLDAALAVLRDSNDMLTTDEIVDRVFAQGHAGLSRSSAGSNISTAFLYAEKDDPWLHVHRAGPRPYRYWWEELTRDPVDHDASDGDVDVQLDDNRVITTRSPNTARVISQLPTGELLIQTADEQVWIATPLEQRLST